MDGCTCARGIDAAVQGALLGNLHLHIACRCLECITACSAAIEALHRMLIVYSQRGFAQFSSALAAFLVDVYLGMGSQLCAWAWAVSHAWVEGVQDTVQSLTHERYKRGNRACRDTSSSVAYI